VKYVTLEREYQPNTSGFVQTNQTLAQKKLKTATSTIKCIVENMPCTSVYQLTAYASKFVMYKFLYQKQRMTLKTCWLIIISSKNITFRKEIYKNIGPKTILSGHQYKNQTTTKNCFFLLPDSEKWTYIFMKLFWTEHC